MSVNQVDYPESDGSPIGETDAHISLLTYLREALRDYFRDDPQVYVAGNLFFYYEEGNIFDPTADYLEPQLWAYRLETKAGTTEYVRVLDEVIHSPLLGLDLVSEGDILRLRNPHSGEKLLTPLEAQAAYRAEAEARRAAVEARRAAEAEAARLRAELAALRSKLADNE